MRTAQIHTLSGRVPVIVSRVVGPFVVHRDHMLNRRWRLTHEATGYSVGGPLPSCKLATALAQSLSTMRCWEFTDPMTPRTWSKSRIKRIRSLILAYEGRVAPWVDKVAA